MRTAARCCSDARSRRGNQAIGAPIVRPSTRSTHKVSSSQRTALAEMLMPRPFDFFAPAFNNSHQVRQFAARKPGAIGDGDFRAQPKLRFIVAFFDVGVNRLAGASFVREEKEPRTALSKNDWHHRAIAQFATEPKAAQNIAMTSGGDGSGRAPLFARPSLHPANAAARASATAKSFTLPRRTAAPWLCKCAITLK